MAYSVFDILRMGSGGISSPQAIDDSSLSLMPVTTKIVSSPAAPSAVTPQTAVTTAGGQNQNVAATLSGNSPLPVATGLSNLLGGDSVKSSLVIVLAVVAIGYVFLKFAANRV